jgi:hypothetical protein
MARGPKSQYLGSRDIRQLIFWLDDLWLTKYWPSLQTDKTIFLAKDQVTMIGFTKYQVIVFLAKIQVSGWPGTSLKVLGGGWVVCR